MNKSRLFKFIFIFLILLSISSCENKYEFSTKDGFIYNQQGHIINYKGNDEVVTIPEKIGDVNIFSFSLSGKIEAEKLYIPSTIKYIGSINENISFDEIFYEGTVKSWCDNIKIIDYNYSSNHIFMTSNKINFKNELGEYYTIKEKLIIPEDVTGISVGQLVLNVNEIVLPKSITKIEPYAFGNRNLNAFDKIFYDGNIADWCKIELSRTERLMSTNEFYIKNNNEYSMVETLTISSDIKTVGKNQFSHLTNLENINIEYGVEFIHPGAFNMCNKIKKVVIPNYLNGLCKFLNNYDDIEFTYINQE